MAEAQSEQAIAKPKSQQQVDEPVTEEQEPIVDPAAEAQKQNHAWHAITDHVTMNFRGKRMTFNDIVRHVHKVCQIGEYTDLIGVRHKEERIGNLISDIYIQKAKASYAYGKLEGQRVARLGKFVSSKDRRSSAMVEAYMAANDEQYAAILELQSDCKSTLDFWHDMYNICLRSTDRLKQISMAIMAEMKLEPSENGGRGERVRGTA